MAWTYFPLSVATLPAKGLQEWGIWQELIDAINERYLVLGGGFSNPFTDITAAGTATAQAAAKIAMQRVIEGLVPGFVVHANNGGNWTGLETIPTYTFNNNATTGILGASFANVGDGTSWTRRAGSDPDALSTFYGRVIAGDVHGLYREGGVDKIAEYLNEMYRVLNLLRWTKTALPPGQGNVNGRLKVVSNGYRQGYAAGRATQALAFTDAQTDINLQAFAGFADVTSEQAFNYEYGEKYAYWSTSGGLYDGYAIQTRFKLNSYFTITPTGSSWYSLDLYGYADEVNSGHLEDIEEWDDEGLGLINGKLNLLETFPETINYSQTTGFFADGSLTFPTPNTNSNEQVGYIYRKVNVSRVFQGVHKWDGPSGFTKVS